MRKALFTIGRDYLLRIGLTLKLLIIAILSIFSYGETMKKFFKNELINKIKKIVTTGHPNLIS